MIPNYLKRPATTRLKPCQERMVGTCDVVSTDQCCGVIPCKICLEWETYEAGISYGSADFATSSWTGTVGGGSFVAYWERNTYNECEFVVVFDGDEVYRATCDEGASCRNPSGEVAAAIGYDEGTLRWSVYEPRELQLTEDPDTGCRDFFCGSCRCSCDCLCVTITDAANDVTTGEICDVSYPCDAPVWEGTVGYYELSIALGRDEYGRCIITAIVGGEEQAPVLFPGCADGAATITLGDGTTIAVTCKKCSCDETPLTCCSCDATYVGCTAATLADDCLNDTIAGDVWSLTSAVSSPYNDWGTRECSWFWTQNFVLSREGCSPVETCFNLFQVTSPSAFAESLGVQACDWVLEIWADNVYQGYVLEFARECIFEVETASNTLDWVQFYNVPVPGTSAEITLTMVRYESPSDLCVPSGRP